MTPVTDIRKGDLVIYLGRQRLVTKIAHYDADGLSCVNFQDGRWLHCTPDHLLQRVG